MMKLLNYTAVAASLSIALATPAYADKCSEVAFADVGWTAETATTAMSGMILEALGYEVDIKVVSVPVTYASMANGDIDAFLGNWMPSMAADIEPFVADGSVEVLRPVVEGAKYTLATNAAGAALGIKDFSDISQHAEALKSSIIGIEPGNDGNRLILDMISTNAFGLGGFELKESSEQGMLAQVARSDAKDEPVIFLGWAPHPMNNNFDMTYLTGGDDYFGPDFGAAVVYSNIRAGYIQECPNVGKFLSNLSFSVDMENVLMAAILDDGAKPEVAARDWLTANTNILDTWLEGVTTRDGGDAINAVKAKLAK
ncbi:MAG: choline ABC transporter substrate-binding protein [Alphaproteobacteria bacterium]